ncbi:MAG: polyketide synthase dehydratase domain-containing protein, partial [Verrucomicrobiae bacterium]|nr:polyketide synthase dehydratase domain-containing protein [Verrucomicrobiae bacterium]
GEYWWRNVRETVLFAPALTGMVRGGEDTFVEIGPHPALQNPILECLSEQGRKGYYFNSLKRKADESVEMLTNLAQLHIHGYRLDWPGVNQAAGGGRADLPLYSWQRERFWLESVEGEYFRCAPEEHPLLGLKQTAPRPSWRFELDPRYFAWLDDHRFWDSVVFPASGYGEIGLAVARKLFPGENYAVEDLEMKKALFVSETKVPTVQVVFDPETRVFQVFSATGDRKEWDLNSQGVLRKQPVPKRATFDFEAVKARTDKHFGHVEYYEDYSKAGYQFRPLFQHLQNVWRRKGESLAEIVAPEGLHDTIPDFHFHPAVLDACFHTVKGGQVPPEGAKATDYFYLPAAIRSIRLLVEKPPHRLWGHARVNTDNDREYVIADIDVYDDQGNLVAEILGFRADRVEQSDGDDLDKCLYQARWEPLRLKGTRVAGSAALAAPAEIVEATDSALPEFYAQRQLNEHYEKFMPLIDQASRQFIVNAYLDLGWRPVVGDRITIPALMAHLDIADQHRKLMYGQLTALIEGGWLKQTGDEEWEVVKAPEFECAIELLDRLSAELPRFASEVELQRATGPNLAGILSGEIDPLEVLFPGGSSDMMETFYREGADFPVINPLIRVALEKTIARLPVRRAIRVLEVGAGTGSLTKSILPVFPPDRTEYVFSDNGPLFVQSAKDKFSEPYPFVEYTLFDCERDPVDQGLDAHSFDIVLASNVIHATADLKQTLAKLRRCLAPDGLLMFLEVTWRRAPLDNVFGLLPGWWRFSDTELREHSALLSRDRWEALLTDCGFRDTTSFISSPKPEEDQQACLIARAPEPVEVPDEADEVVPAPAVVAEAAEVPAVCVLMGGSDALALEMEPALAEKGQRLVRVGADHSELATELAQLDADGAKLVSLVHALSLEHPRAEGLDLASLEKAQETGVHSAHELFKLITNREWPQGRPRMFFLTRGVMPVTDEDKVDGIASAPLTGFIRVANNEKAEFICCQIDLDPAGAPFEGRDILDEILLSDGEHEVALRGHHRHVRRVHRVKREELPPRSRNAVQADGSVLPYRLQIDKPGILTNLSLNETTRRDPEPDEIEIRIKAGGINFRDVMKALGMYPGSPKDLKWFGDDFSGEVVRVGANVTDLKPGDAVVGMAPYCFRSYVTVHRSMVFRKPETMSHTEAATLPTVFLTTHYAINELARMRKGESILIHAGTGGV